MCSVDIKNGDTRIDPCMRNLIKYLQAMGIKTLSCCCGHKKYPMTIVVNSHGGRLEICSGLFLGRTKKFYKRDKQGVYFIPETLKVKGGLKKR